MFFRISGASQAYFSSFKGLYSTSSQLSEPQLSKSLFIRTHQSLLFNMNFIIILQDGGHLVVCYSLFLSAEFL